MATTTITDLPGSRALDYKAMTAIRGALGDGNWCLYAFVPFRPAVAPSLPIVNFYQTNYIADQLNLQVQNIDIKNLGSGMINVDAAQNALNLIHAGPASPH
jgi:hypothetical protein